MIFANRTFAPWLAASTILATAIPASAETYLTEAQALGVLFGDAGIVKREEKVLDPMVRAQLEHSTDLNFRERTYTFFVADRDGKPARYAIVMNEIGKTEPITLMVGISPERKVTDVVIMVFRENRGWEVKEKRFLNQFRGKTAKSSIRINEDIINYTGATLSSKAVAHAVKKALALFETFYPGPARQKSSNGTDFARPSTGEPVTTTEDGSLGLYRQTRYAMGTLCEIRVWCATSEIARGAFGAGFAEIRRIERIFSAYDEDSELSLVNRVAASRTIPVSEEFYQLTARAVSAWRKSGGIVDATVAPLMKLWGIMDGQARIPTTEQLARVRETVGGDKIQLDARAQAISFKKEGVALDFGGMAKGHAARRVVRMLERREIEAALVNLGSSTICASEVTGSVAKNGARESRQLKLGDWPVAIRNVCSGEAPPMYILLEPGRAISTSGTSEKQYSVGKTQYAHVLDPRNGQPLEGIRSVTGITRSGVGSEILSKELLIRAAALGEYESRRNSGKDWISQREEAGALQTQANLRNVRRLLAT